MWEATHRIHSTWSITKKFVASDYVGDPYGCVKFGTNPSTGASGQMGELQLNFYLFIYLFIPFFINSPTVQTRRRVFTLDGSNDADSRKNVPFGGFVDTAFHFGGEIPNCWGVYKRFQAKRAKYWKFYVIETTASILTKYGTMIETIKWPSRGQPPFWKKNVKSPYLCDHSTDFDKIWLEDEYLFLAADQPLKVLNFWKKTRYLLNGLTIFTKFGILMQNGSLNLFDR